MSEKEKYLSQLLMKGLKKNNFNPIIKWLQNVDLNSKHLILLIKSDEESIHIMLNTLKSGLLSKNNDIALFSCRILLKIIEELIDLNLQPVIWDWFCQDSGGLQTCILGLKKQTQIKEYIGNILLLMGKDNTIELFTVELKKNLSDNYEYICLIDSFLEQIANSQIISSQVKIKINFYVIS